MAIVGLIPAAGRGKRLAPLPMAKELFPIGYQDYEIEGTMYKRPKVVSQYLVEHMVAAGVGKIIIALGPDKHDVMHYYGNGGRFGIDISYVYQEEMGGMPFALDLAFSWLNPDDDVIFGMPDTIIEPFDAFKQLHDARVGRGADLVLGLFVTDTPHKFGMVMIDDDGNVVETIDKPSETTLNYMWGNAGWGPVFSRFMHEYLQEHSYQGKEIVLGDVFNAAIREGMRVVAHVYEDGKYIDIGTVEELDSALQIFRL